MVFPKIIAHRGMPLIAPENTMASFKVAKKINVDMIETDVQLSKDGEIVICHDEKLNRTTNGTGFLKDYTLCELKELSAGIKFGESFKDEKIPLLSELLELLKNTSIGLNIEIKSGIIIYPQIEKKVIAMVNDYNMINRVIISSFNHYSLLECKNFNSTIKTAVLYMAGLVKPWEYAKNIGADALHPLFYNIRPEIMAGIKASGIMVNPFTVDEEYQMKYMISMGVNGIITNCPDKLLKIKNRLEV